MASFEDVLTLTVERSPSSHDAFTSSRTPFRVPSMVGPDLRFVYVARTRLIGPLAWYSAFLADGSSITSTSPGVLLISRPATWVRSMTAAPTNELPLAFVFRWACGADPYVTSNPDSPDTSPDTPMAEPSLIMVTWPPRGVATAPPLRCSTAENLPMGELDDWVIWCRSGSLTRRALAGSSLSSALSTVLAAARS